MPAQTFAGPLLFHARDEDAANPGSHGGAGNFTIVNTIPIPGQYDPGIDPSLVFTTLKLTPKFPAGSPAGATAWDTTPFWVAVTPTDTASGQTGTAKLTGTAYSEYATPAGGTPVLTKEYIAFDGTGTQTLTLGGNNYTFQGTGAQWLTGSSASTDLVGTVALTVLPAGSGAGSSGSNPTTPTEQPTPPVVPPAPMPVPTADTPEPGTLVLAGMGLLPAANFLRRRRQEG